jgi:hypothetical protein
MKGRRMARIGFIGLGLDSFFDPSALNHRLIDQNIQSLVAL